jgi:hypothetical protein
MLAQKKKNKESDLEIVRVKGNRDVEEWIIESIGIYGMILLFKHLKD